MSRTVYPRTRGATDRIVIASSRSFGLSPHARGNHGTRHDLGEWRGSIPARAGQPRTRLAAMRAGWVYPRTRGATSTLLVVPPESVGLSPHARGNPRACYAEPHRPRSIPARAGQPPKRSPATNRHRVYPRTRGATEVILQANAYKYGLSPHARGNHSGNQDMKPVPGSIPARAGQPR